MMSGPRRTSNPRNQRISFSQQSANRSVYDPEEATNLSLNRTRSHDVSIVESVAVQEPDEELKPHLEGHNGTATETQWPASTRYLILLCAFITSSSFGVTQVPMLYVFRLMTCDAYYKDHPDPSTNSTLQQTPTGVPGVIMSSFLTNALHFSSTSSGGTPDRCAIRAIESATALNIALVGASTTLFGIANLFITGGLIKTIGLKRSLVINVGAPAIRLLIQNLGLEVWGNTGIVIVQLSQIVNILGGPSGYLLVLNSFMTEVVEYEARTAALGRVAGAMMAGSALGFLLGGIVAEDFGIKAPFRMTLALFVIASLYVATALPYVPPSQGKGATALSDAKKQQTRIQRFFGPLLVFAPKKFITRSGAIQTEFGTFLLACGVFLGILATGYLPTLLQLYSTDVFSFGTKANGWLIFMYSLLRGAFLTFVFPNVIAIGRRITRKAIVTTHSPDSLNESDPSEQDPLLSSNANANNTSSGPVQKKDETFAFDLIYTRVSLLADGLLTLLCTFVREGWQMYLVAAILPFAAGTGSAAKGTVLQMVGSHASSDERTDALAGLSLVENMARLATTFVFGVIFAAFASIGRPDLVFTCNAAVATFGFLILLFARFPPEGSRRLDLDEAIE